MEFEKTQIKNADNQSEKSVDNAASNKQHQPVKKFRKLRPFAVMAS